jgi:hypothetical protein
VLWVSAGTTVKQSRVVLRSAGSLQSVILVSMLLLLNAVRLCCSIVDCAAVCAVQSTYTIIDVIIAYNCELLQY